MHDPKHYIHVHISDLIIDCAIQRRKTDHLSTSMSITPCNYGPCLFSLSKLQVLKPFPCRQISFMRSLLFTQRFCLGTEVPRHSAGCVGTWYVRTSLFAMRPRKVNRVSNVFIACKYIFKSDYGFAWLLMNLLPRLLLRSYNT